MGIAPSPTIDSRSETGRSIDEGSKAIAGLVMSADDIVKATGTAAFSRGPDGTITSWNAAAELLLSIPAEKAVGRRCYEVINGLDVFGNDFCGESCNCWRMAATNRPIHPYRLVVSDASGRRLGLRVSILLTDGSTGLDLVHLIQLAADCGNAVDANEPDARAPREYARAGLTQRELEVLRHLAQGYSTKETAQMLKISPITVRNHISRCLQKLDAHSRLEAVAVGRRLDLV